METFRGGLVLLHDPGALSLRIQTDGWTLSFRIFCLTAEFIFPAGCPVPEAAKQLQTITLLPPCFTVGIIIIFIQCCVIFCQISRLHNIQKVTLLTHQFTECFSKSLEDHQDTFCQIRDESLCSFIDSRGFPLRILPRM